MTILSVDHECYGVIGDRGRLETMMQRAGSWKPQKVLRIDLKQILLTTEEVVQLIDSIEALMNRIKHVARLIEAEKRPVRVAAKLPEDPKQALAEWENTIQSVDKDYREIHNRIDELRRVETSLRTDLDNFEKLANSGFDAGALLSTGTVGKLLGTIPKGKIEAAQAALRRAAPDIVTLRGNDLDGKTFLLIVCSIDKFPQVTQSLIQFDFSRIQFAEEDIQRLQETVSKKEAMLKTTASKREASEAELSKYSEKHGEELAGILGEAFLTYLTLKSMLKTSHDGETYYYELPTEARQRGKLLTALKDSESELTFEVLPRI